MVGFNFILLDVRTQAVFWVLLQFLRRKRKMYFVFQWINLDADTACGPAVISANLTDGELERRQHRVF